MHNTKTFKVKFRLWDIQLKLHNLAWFQASAAKMRTAQFWVIMQRVVVTAYRRFRITYWSHSQGALNYYSLRNNTEERSSLLSITLPTFHTYKFSTLSSTYSRILLFLEEFEEKWQNFNIIEDNFISSLYL